MILATLGVPETFGVVLLASAVSGTIAAFATRRGLAVPVVVVELFAGILIGPHVLGLDLDSIVRFFADLGVGLLFFFAGYEIDPHVVRGEPLRLATLGWAVSLLIAYSIAALLVKAGIVLSVVFTGSALATTAVGMLIPMLTDTGDLRSRFGTHVLAIGAVGEFGPIMLVTLVLSADSTAHEAKLLAIFVGGAALAGIAVGLLLRRAERAIEVTAEHSSQVAIRWLMVFAFALALFANELGLDLVIGSFVAGLLTRRFAGGELPAVIQSKLNAIAYGIFIPFFFVVSGMNLDVSAVFSSLHDLAKLFTFFVLFFVVRAVPVALLYRREFERTDRLALALMSATQLSMVIPITALARASGHMFPSTQAALVGGAALTALFFPTLALRLRGRSETLPAIESA